MKQKFDFLTPSRPNLEKFSQILLKWQKSVNLIAPSTIPQIWERHILDSAQLYPYIPTTAKTLVDIGSGAGLPGLVLAILNKDLSGPLTNITLIESDMKKCIFMREAARELGLKVHVENERVEKVTLPNVDVLVARALADVPTLLKWSKNLINPTTTCLFLKGAKADDEIKTLSNKYAIQKHPSLIDSTGCILQIKELKNE